MKRQIRAMATEPSRKVGQGDGPEPGHEHVQDGLHARTPPATKGTLRDEANETRCVPWMTRFRLDVTPSQGLCSRGDVDAVNPKEKRSNATQGSMEWMSPIDGLTTRI